MKNSSFISTYFYILYIVLNSNKSLHIAKATQYEFRMADSSNIVYHYTIFLIFLQICINIFYF